MFYNKYYIIQYYIILACLLFHAFDRTSLCLSGARFDQIISSHNWVPTGVVQLVPQLQENSYFAS